MTHLIQKLKPQQTSEDHLIRSLIKERKWSLRESIVSLESAYPFYDCSDVAALLIMKRKILYGAYYIFKRRVSIKALRYKIKSLQPTISSIALDIDSILR